MLSLLNLRMAYHAYAQLCSELAPMLDRLRAIDANGAVQVEGAIVTAITGGRAA